MKAEEGLWSSKRGQTPPAGPVEESKERALEIVFICDSTGSMENYLVDVKSGVHEILANAWLRYKFSTIRMGCVLYRDHTDGNGLLGCFPLTTSLEEIEKFIASIPMHGGGDSAEAVVDALDCVLKLEWGEDSVKIIVHFTDSGAHGAEFANVTDSFPAGCPCGKDYRAILSALHRKDISYVLVSYSQYAERMANVFSLHHPTIQCVAPPSSLARAQLGEVPTALGAGDRGDPNAVVLFSAAPMRGSHPLPGFVLRPSFRGFGAEIDREEGPPHFSGNVRPPPGFMPIGPGTEHVRTQRPGLPTECSSLGPGLSQVADMDAVQIVEDQRRTAQRMSDAISQALLQFVRHKSYTPI